VAVERTRIRRLPEKAVQERATMDAILDAGRVAHLAITADGQPYALPVGYARDGDRVLVHGSTGSQLFRALASGAAACLTVTLVDGLVLARSAFESSMHYRSAMVLGRASVVDDQLAALRVLTEHLLPGRWAQLRPPHKRELAATLVLAIPLDEWSVKVSDGPPDDAEEDLGEPVWAGVVPVVESYGPPVAAPGVDPRFAPPPWATG
jgi:nitroimidazol reductase NimA-like FMN-containing flavoprotein (pyridoxamine 5'-phosphate oxidase superfamily)